MRFNDDINLTKGKVDINQPASSNLISSADLPNFCVISLMRSSRSAFSTGLHSPLASCKSFSMVDEITLTSREKTEKNGVYALNTHT